jgi:hypothetical protein
MKLTKKQISYFKKTIIYLFSFLGALGTGIQNYMAVVALFKELIEGSIKLTKVGLGILHGLAIGVGGVCSTVVNFCLNVELLESFMQRLTGKKPMPKLHGWQKFRYWFGSGVFIVTGILFGLTALAVSATGPLAILAIAVGVLVAGIMVIQELETWLESFDEENNERKSLWEMFLAWKESLTKSKFLGILIAVGNVVALSLLFTAGLATFFIATVGVPFLPAIIVAFVVAFTGGAFTEFYFYNRFISKFCDNFAANMKKFWESKYSPLGLVTASTNGVVNGILGYVGIMLLAALLISASVVMPPSGIMIGVIATAAVFAGLASFILGLDFWQKKFGKKEEPLKQKKIVYQFGKNTKEISAGLLEKPAKQAEVTAAVVTSAVASNLPKAKPASGKPFLRFLGKKAAKSGKATVAHPAYAFGSKR